MSIEKANKKTSFNTGQSILAVVSSVFCELSDHYSASLNSAYLDIM